MKSRNSGSLLILLAGTFWGLSGIFVKYLTSAGASPLFTTYCRLMPALLGFIIFSCIKYGYKAFRIDFKTLLSCAFTGLVGQVLFNICYSTAIKTIGMSYSAILLYISPVITAICSALFFSEKITLSKALCLLLNLIGCALTVTGGAFSSSDLQIVGILFGLGAGFCYSMDTVMGRVTTNDAEPLVALAWIFFFAGLFMTIFMHPWSGMTGSFDFKFGVMAIVYSLLCTFTPYACYFSGIKQIDELTKVPVIASVEPVVASLIGGLIFHEDLGIVNVLGIFLVVFSIFLMNRRSFMKKSRSV